MADERVDGRWLAARLRVMVLTRPRPAGGRPLADVVSACLEGGATAVQLRDKEARDDALFELARSLLPRVHEHGALLLVDDRVDVALAAGAHGAHLGPADLPLAAARSLVPPGFVLGFSCDRPDVAVRAAREGADYLGVGAVYGTGSKPGLADERIGSAAVGRVLRAAGLPGVGIGGIDPGNAAAVAREGAGVAVLSAVMDAPDPAAVTRALRRAVDAAWAAGSGSGWKRDAPRGV